MRFAREAVRRRAKSTKVKKDAVLTANDDRVDDGGRHEVVRVMDARFAGNCSGRKRRRLVAEFPAVTFQDA